MVVEVGCSKAVSSLTGAAFGVHSSGPGLFREAFALQIANFKWQSYIKAILVEVENNWKVNRTMVKNEPLGLQMLVSVLAHLPHNSCLSLDKVT